MLEQPKKNLQRVIHSFISQMGKAMQLLKSEPSLLSKEEIDKLAEKIWDLRHYAVELLEQHPDESTWYNASIIQQIVEQPIDIPGSYRRITLIEAADQTKKHNNDSCLRLILTSFVTQDAYREVLFTNLQEISQELVA